MALTPARARRLATGLNAVLVGAAVAGLLGLGAELADRHRVRIDLTRDGAATLLPETLSALRMAEERDTTVVLTAFSAQHRNAEARVRNRAMRDFLRELELASDHVETHFIDMDRDRLTAEQRGVDRYGTVLVEAVEDRVDLLDRNLFQRRGAVADGTTVFIGEPVIAGAIRKVLSQRGRTVYFLTGHGEQRIFDRGLGDLEALAELIGNQGWRSDGLDLLRDAEGAAPEVPADASAVVVVGPRTPLAPTEEAALRSFLGRGGSVGLFLEPGGPTPDLLEELGVYRAAGVVLDPRSVYPHTDRPPLGYGAHPITEALASDAATVVARAAPVRADPRDGVTATAVLRTSRLAWAERGSERPPELTPGTDEQGPFDVALALALAPPHPIARDRTPRVLVVGDADLVSDELLGEGPGNASFAAGALSWLVRAEGPVGRVGRAPAVRMLTLSRSALTGVRAVLVVVLPLLVGSFGAWVLAARRFR